MTNTIIWTQLGSESADDRIARLNATLHRIFFDGKEICPDKFRDHYECRFCNACILDGPDTFKHGTPRFLESLDAMQLIVTSGRFAEVREEYYHWLAHQGKEPYECRILLYGSFEGELWFQETGKTRQDAFFMAALKSQGYSVVVEEQGENNEDNPERS